MTTFEDDVGRIIPQLRRFARALAPEQSVQVADDLVQETVVLAMRSDRRPPAAILMWCLATLIRVHRLRHGKVPRDGRIRGGSSVCASTGALARPFVPDQGASLMAGLDTLSLEGRETLLLVSVAGLSYAQAAEVLGTTPDIVIARLTEARDRLLATRVEGPFDGAERSAASPRATGHLRLVK